MIDEDLQARLDAAMRAGAERSGIPLEPFTDVEKREAKAYGEAMAAVSAIHICGVLDDDGVYDEFTAFDTSNVRSPVTGRLTPQGDMIFQMCAAERYKGYLEDRHSQQDVLIDSRHAPGYVERDPLTANRLYVLTMRSKYAIALETPYDWRTCLLHTLGGQTRCDLHLLGRCYDHQVGHARFTLVYKRGDYVFAWRICDECLEALSWINFGHPDYAGPLHKWVDDGDRPPTVEF